MKKIKLGAWAVVLACAMAACLGLAGCGSSGPTDEEVIAEGISTTLDQVKSLDDATLDEMVAEAGNDLDELADLGIDSRELFKSVFDGFDYNISSIDVKDNSAAADIAITAKSFNDADDKAEQLATDWVANASEETLANMTEADINAKIGELVMQSLNETSPKTTTVNVTFTKQNNEWSCDDDLLSEVVDKAFYA